MLFENDLSLFLFYFLGMFSTVASSNCAGVSLSPEQGDMAVKPPADPSPGIYDSYPDSSDIPHPDEAKVSHTLSSIN